MDENRIEHVEFNDIRKTGLWGNIDKKRTMISAYKRNAMRGKASFHPIHQEDLKFRTWNEVLKPDSKAVVLAMMDTSDRWEYGRNIWHGASFLDDEISTHKV